MWGIVFAAIAFTAVLIGQGLQQPEFLPIEGDPPGRRPGRRALSRFLGGGLSMAGVYVAFFALWNLPASQVSTLVGVGLLVCLLAKYVFHRWRPPFSAVASMFVILAGTALVMLFPGKFAEGELRWKEFESYIPALAVPVILVLFGQVYPGVKGWLESAAAGTLGTLTFLFQKISVIRADRIPITPPDWVHFLGQGATPWLWLVCAMVAHLVLMLAYRSLKATAALSIFCFAFLATTFPASIFLFGGKPAPLTWVGFALLLAGTLLATRMALLDKLPPHFAHQKWWDGFFRRVVS